MEYTKDILERKIKENLSVSDEDLKTWEESRYFVSEKVVGEFWSHIKPAPGVAVIGDYDCDGICATYIGIKSIRTACPDKKMYVRIPRRFSEGYGFNSKIADEIREKLPKGSVIVTVDNGISAGDLLEDLEKDGYKVLLTDHHELKEGLAIPNVTMVINPSVPGADEGFEFKKWCGAAIMYKLAEQVVSEELAKTLEVYAGVATVADCMELTGGNWGMVRRTAKAFREGKAPEALTLMAIASKQDPTFATEDMFGYYLGPCFNAAGRLADEGPNAVLKYLLKPDEKKLDQLIEYNTERRRLRDEEYEIVKAKIEEEGQLGKSPAWVYVPGLHEGIVGILAGKLSEEYGISAIVLTDARGKEGIAKGSARSAGNFDMFEYLSSVSDLLESFGGHPGAAGLSLKVENFEKLKATQKDVSIEEAKEQTDTIHIIPEDIPEIYRVLNKYRPFGEGNPAPEFSLDFVESIDTRYIGSEQNHLLDQPCSKAYKITHFNHKPNNLKSPKLFGMDGKITGTSFNGVETPTFNADRVYDIVPAPGNTKEGKLGIKTAKEERSSELASELEF